MIPLAHQKRFSDIAPASFGIWHACGTGKTFTGLYTISQRVYTCLIICPKGIKSKWQEVVKDFKDNVFNVLTKEEFKKVYQTLGKFEGVIIDEAHHFSGLKSQLHKSLFKYLKSHGIKHVLAMTATPYRREPMNVYALGRILGHNWSYIEFRNKFYRLQYFGQRAVWVPKTGIEQDIANLLKKIGDVVAFEECGDLPPIQHKIEYFDLTIGQKKALKELEMTEANPLVYYGKEHQICAGIGANTAKTARLLELADTTPKLAIFCRYTAQIEATQAILEQNGHKVFVINGATKDKDLTAKEVENSDRCTVIVQMDCAEGFELPSISTIAFAGMSYSYLAYVQSMGRFIRVNKQNTPKLFIYMLTSKSIDEAVYENLIAKKDFDLALYCKEKIT